MNDYEVFNESDFNFFGKYSMGTVFPSIDKILVILKGSDFGSIEQLRGPAKSQFFNGGTCLAPVIRLMVGVGQTFHNWGYIGCGGYQISRGVRSKPHYCLHLYKAEIHITYNPD